MKTTKITTEAPTVNRTVDIDVALPVSTSDAVDAWGEDVVLSLITNAATVRVQANIRGKLKATGDERLTNPKIIEGLKGWKPTSGGTRLSVEERVKRFKAQMEKHGIDVSQLQ